VWGKTPLVAAVERGALGVVRLLLEHAADPELVDDDGHSPLQTAEEWANRDVEAELRRRAAPGPGEELHCDRIAQADGTDLIIVNVCSRGGGGRTFEQQTGHRKIAHLLLGLESG
jgi:ankyrin repeat protein